MMEKTPQYWLMVALFMVGGLFYVQLKPDGYQAHRTQLVELFNLPEDADFVGFRSPYRRGGLQYIEGVVQFTPGQWLAYVGSLDDRNLWDPRGFEYDDVVVSAVPNGEAVRWYEHEYAWIKDDYASFWLDWGFEQGKELQGKPTVGRATAWQSFCWVVLDEGQAQRVEPCRNYKHGPPGRQFYVRAKLDRENHRLFMYVR